MYVFYDHSNSLAQDHKLTQPIYHQPSSSTMPIQWAISHIVVVSRVVRLHACICSLVFIRIRNRSSSCLCWTDLFYCFWDFLVILVGFWVLLCRLRNRWLINRLVYFLIILLVRSIVVFYSNFNKFN